MLQKTSKRYLEIVTWDQIRQEVNRVNPELAEIIDEISPNKTYQLIKANYQYGDLIVDNGMPQFPDDKGELLALSNSKAAKVLKESLSYSHIPLFLTLKNDNEVFVDNGNRIIPLNLFHAGALLGAFETSNYLLDCPSHRPRWSVSAGSRSIVMLPKITEAISLKRLRKHYDIPSVIQLKTLNDHWHFFKLMSQHHAFEQSWDNTVLFFTKDWINLKNSSGWSKFRNYLLKQTWQQAQFAIGRIEFALNWEVVSEAVAQRNLKPRPYLVSHIKQLLGIASGRLPGFKPADQSQHAAPTQAIQKAFIDIYNLKDYLPTLMHIGGLDNVHRNKNLYYSLSFPTLLEGSPFDKQTSTIMHDVRDIKLVIDTLKQYLKSKTSLEYGFLENHEGHEVEFDYFHTENDIYNEIKNSDLLVETDRRLLSDQKLFPDRDFCSSSIFWRGCIKIQQNSTK